MTINKACHSQIHKILRQGKNHESSKGKKVLNLQGKTDQVSSRPTTELWQARKEWQDIFNVLNQKNMQLTILYPGRLSFKIEGEIKSFPDKQKVKEFMTTNPALKEILRGIL